MQATTLKFSHCRHVSTLQQYRIGSHLKKIYEGTRVAQRAWRRFLKTEQLALPYLGADCREYNSTYKLMQKKRRKPMEGKSSSFQTVQELPSPMTSQELWVRPGSNLRQGREPAAEENISPASAERLLALADIALGVRKPVSKSKAKVLPVEVNHQKMSQRKKRIPPHAN